MATTSLAIPIPPIQVIQPPGFQELYQQYSEIVYRTALRVTGRPSDAEDVLQTVFLRLLNSEVLFDPQWSPGRYLRRAATNAGIDLIRRRSIQAEAPLEASATHAVPDAKVLLKEHVRRALAKLPEEEAELFVLCYLEGLTYAELADQFGMERGTVASRLFRIRQTLQNEISK